MLEVGSFLAMNVSEESESAKLKNISESLEWWTFIIIIILSLGVLGISVLLFQPSFRLFFFLISHQKTSVFSFWCLLQFVVSVLFGSQFPVFSKNKIAFLDLLFPAVCYFSGFPLENMRAQQPKLRTCLLWICLRFSVLNEIYFGFAVSIIFCTVLRFLT